MAVAAAAAEQGQQERKWGRKAWATASRRVDRWEHAQTRHDDDNDASKQWAASLPQSIRYLKGRGRCRSTNTKGKLPPPPRPASASPTQQPHLPRQASPSPFASALSLVLLLPRCPSFHTPLFLYSGYSVEMNSDSYCPLRVQVRIRFGRQHSALLPFLSGEDSVPSSPAIVSVEASESESESENALRQRRRRCGKTA